MHVLASETNVKYNIHVLALETNVKYNIHVLFYPDIPMLVRYNNIHFLVKFLFIEKNSKDSSIRK
jgi:hypothetical protein